MVYTNIRIGPIVKVAIKKQSALGTPATGFVAADLVRAMGAPSIQHNAESIPDARRGTHGSRFERAEGHVLGSREPRITFVAHANRKFIQQVLEGSYDKAMAGTPLLLTSPGFKSDFFYTVIWRDGTTTHELRDAVFESAKFTSTEKGHLMIEVVMVGISAPDASSDPFADTDAPDQFDVYAHKNMTAVDATTGTGIEIHPINLEVSLEPQTIVSHANSVGPGVIFRDGFLNLTGGYEAFFTNEQETLYNAIRNKTLVAFEFGWVQQDGKDFRIEISKAELSGDRPGRKDDQTFDTFKPTFMPLLEGVVEPITFILDL